MKLHAEPFHSTGAMGGQGALKLLGSLNFDFWSHVMRETIQNVWDAADPDRCSPVEFLADLRTYSREDWEPVWEGVFGRTVPPSNDRGSEFPGDWGQLKPAGPRKMLVLADRNSNGMGGPDQADSGNLFDTIVPRDFADFVYNLGVPPDTKSGGGTYGYGKSVLYRASLASTIIVHTHCTDELGRPDSRFIAIGLGKPYGDRRTGQPMTGRHWWGDTDTYGEVGPIRGDEADSLAEAIGFPRFEPDERGTSIGITVPNYAEKGHEFLQRIQAASLWHCWPKLLDEAGDPEMRFHFSMNGERIPQLLPRDVDGLGPFCDAYMAMDDPEHVNTHLIRAQRPKRDLGRLHLRRFPEREDPETPLMRPFDGRSRHVAVMRTPNLVVRYYEHPVNPVPSQGWVGVFKALPEMDREFAWVEPPAHDSWSNDAGAGPSGTKTSFPRVALRNIKTLVAEFLSVDLSTGSGTGGSLGELSETLGQLFSPGGGTGIGGSGPAGTPRVASQSTMRPVISVADQELDRESDRLIHRYPFELEHVPGTSGSVLSAKVEVVVVGGATESSSPWGLRGAEVTGFQDPCGDMLPGEQVVVPVDHPGGMWKVVVHGPLRTEIRLRLDAVSATDEEVD